MDKPDLDFLIDSQDINLLYKYLIKAIGESAERIRQGFNQYTVDCLLMHAATDYVLYSKQDYTLKGRLDKYVMEL